MLVVKFLLTGMFWSCRGSLVTIFFCICLEFLLYKCIVYWKKFIFQSKDKEYPRLSNTFCEADDILSHKPAIRIVDQRNLYKETKLKLYRDRPKRSEDGPSTTEKKFRMMLEREKSLASKSSRSSRQTT